MRRRWLVSAVCFLALGAVSTVALCWLVAGVRVEVGTWVWPPEGEGHEASVRRWNVVEERSWCATLRWLSVSTSLSPLRSCAEDWPTWSVVPRDPHDRYDVYFEGSYGWPWDAMWHRVNQSPLRFLTVDDQSDGGLPVEVVAAQFRQARPAPPPPTLVVVACSEWDPTEHRPSALPLHLTWAFVGDAAVHALLWFGLLHLSRAPGALLAWRRHRRRTCVRCGYDCTATPRRCPECGTEVEGRRACWRPAVFLPAILAIGGAAALVTLAAIGRNRFVPEEKPIEHAARVGDLETVRDIIAMGVEASDVTIAAEWAAAHDQRAVVRELMPDLGGVSVVRVFDAAIANGHAELAREIRRCASDDDLATDFLFAALDADCAEFAAELYETCRVPDPERLIGLALRGASPDLVRRLVARIAVEEFYIVEDAWCEARHENVGPLFDRLVRLVDDLPLMSNPATGLEWTQSARRPGLIEVLTIRVRRRLADDAGGSRWIGVTTGIVDELWRAGRPDLIVSLIDRLRTAGLLDFLVADIVEYTNDHTIMALIHCGVDVVAVDPDGVRAMCDTWKAELANDPSPWLSEVLSLAAVRARLAEFDAASAGGAGEPRGR